jgi:hypothetical protein
MHKPVEVPQQIAQAAMHKPAEVPQQIAQTAMHKDFLGNQYIWDFCRC